jgi:uncharacterized protein (TIGR02271 family)
MMIDRQHLDRLPDLDVYGSDGEKIGTIDDVYVDDATGEPTFALVNTGLFGLRSSFVPLQRAELTDDAIRVGYTKDKVKDAPNMDKDGRLEPSEEDELYRYYGMGAMSGGRSGEGTAGGTGMAEDRGTMDRDAGRGTDDAMTRSEEELHVGTREREIGKARLRKHVVTEHVTKTVPVQREEVRVEREPITGENLDAATSGPAISEDEHEVTLRAEEPVVEKRAVPKERVRLDKDTHVDQETVEDDVAREEIDVAGLESSREERRR